MTTWIVPATIKRVIDADTLVCDLDLGWQLWLVDRHVRLAHIDAPERHTEAGRAALDAVRELIWPADGLALSPVTVRSERLDKFGRVLGDVLLGPDAISLSAWLLEHGYAVAYEGGPR